MSTRLFEKGRQYLADAGDWDSDVIKAMAIDASVTDVAVKPVTGATNATPIVVTCTSHGFANGDIVTLGKVGGNTAANGTWQIANQATNTFELKTRVDALNSTGNGAYTSGGYAVNLTISDFVDDISAGRVGTDQTLASKTLVNGVLDAADITFPTFTGTVDAIVIYDNQSGAEATSPPLVYVDGKMQVTVAADAAGSATTLWVEPLAGAIASGVTIVMSNGVTVTLSGSAAAGARSLAVNALSGPIAAGHQGDVATTGSGLPAVIANSALAVAWDNGANRIVKL